MSTIVILFILILCVACFKQSKTHDYSREDARRMQRMRQRQMEQEESSEEEEEDPKTLKEEHYDRFFPVIDVQDHLLKKTGINDEICSICIDKIVNNEKIRQIKFCKHYFHKGCLNDWFNVTSHIKTSRHEIKFFKC